MRTGWTRLDILQRYRWRLALYWLGWTGVAGGFVCFLWVGATHGFDDGVTIGGTIAVAFTLLMIPASQCLNCGSRLPHIFGFRGIQCHDCGAVHFDPWGGAAVRDMPGSMSQGEAFPSNMNYCWLYPPFVSRFTLRWRLARLGKVLGALAGVAFIVLLATVLGAFKPPVAPEALLWFVGIGLVIALATHAGAGRCPHCRKAFSDSHRAWQSNRLATWCGRCGAVLKASRHGYAAFAAAGRVVDEPPKRNE